MHQIVPYNFITGQHFSLSGIVSPNFLSHKVKVHSVDFLPQNYAYFGIWKKFRQLVEA